MKIQTALTLTGTCVLVTAAFTAGVWAQATATQQSAVRLWHWPDSMDSINAAPKNHKLLFENDHIRLLEVTVQPGETENMHGHKYPSVFMMDAPQPKIVNKNLDDADAVQPGNKPPPPRNDSAPVAYPTCRAMPTFQSPHQVTNVDTFPQHFYRMEFKKIDGDTIREMKSYPPQ